MRRSRQGAAHHRALPGRCEHRGIGDRRRDPTTDGRPCRPAGSGSGLRSGLDSPSLGPTSPDGGIRRSARRGPGSRSAGRGRTAHRRRLRRSGRWSRRPGFGIRGRPTGIPTTDRPSGIPTIRRGPRRRAASGRPRRIGVVRPPGTGRRQPGGTRAPDRPSGSPIRRGLLPGIRDRPTGIHLGRCCIHRARRTGRSFDRCGVHRGRGGVARGALSAAGSGVARAMIRSVPASVAPVVPAVSRTVSGSVSVSAVVAGAVPIPGSTAVVTERATVRPILPPRITITAVGARASCGRPIVTATVVPGSVVPALVVRGRRWVGRPCAGCHRVGRHRGRSSGGRPGRRRLADRRASRCPTDHRGDRRRDSSDRPRSGSHPSGSPAHRGRRAHQRKGEARTIRIGAPSHRPNDRTRRYRHDARSCARPGSRGRGPNPCRVRRRDGSNPIRCRPCPARRRGDQTRHVRTPAGRRDHACHLNLDGLRAPNHDHCLADGYRRSHPRYS